MKKSLVLAMAMALGVTASAYAANPFSDVPAGHWAYDSIEELAAAGVIDGYTDGTFGGDKLMTRYEMAQIVARAMANGADVDALAAEFAEELDALGVRVANLEKKADNVKITGQIRARYIDQEGSDVADLRTRLWVKGAINDDWTYTGMLQNVQDFRDNGGNDDTDLKRAYVEGRLGGVEVTAGRYNEFLGDGLVYDDNVDGVKAAYGDAVKLTVAGGNLADEGEYVAAEAATKVGVVDLAVGYASFREMEGTYGVVDFKDVDNDIFYVEAGAEVLKDLSLKAAYLNGDLDFNSNYKLHEMLEDALNDDDGYTVELAYRGADKAVVGSWGLTANYWDQGGATYIIHTTDANTFSTAGFKGYGVAADYTVAQNIVATLAYYDTESKIEKDYDDQRLWTSVQFYF